MVTFAAIQDRVWRLVEPYAPIGEDSLLRELPLAINLAIRDAEDRLTLRAMEASTELTTVILPASPTQAQKDTSRILGVKPALWREARAKPQLHEDAGGLIEKEWIMDEQEAFRIYDEQATDTGEPAHIQERISDFAVFPYSDSLSDYTDKEYRVRLYYYAYLADLAAITDTNWFTDNATNFLIWAAAGDLLFRVPGQEGRAAALAISSEPLVRPLSKADFELKRVAKAEKRSLVSPRIKLVPRRNVLAPINQKHL